MDNTRRAASAADPLSEQHPGRNDPVRQDQVWKDLVRCERKGLKEWEKNWSFLTEYNQMGQTRSEEVLPSSVPLFSNRTPNTTNQMFGSRLYSPLGRELVRLDRLLLWSGHHKRKLDPEMMPH